MTTTRTTTIALDARVPIIRITRDFDAPRALVFRAHVDPELVVRWLGPHDTQMTVETWDCRTGGAYRYVHSRPGFATSFFGSFHEVRADECIVQTFTWVGMPDSVSLERLDLVDLGAGRTRLVATSLVDSFEARDAFAQSGMEGGVKAGYEKLDSLLAGA